MRPNATKVPYAYFRTATRKRGRPVHRIYSATPRPPMTGLWALYAPFGAGFIFYSMDGGNYWWLQNIVGTSAWTDLKASTHPGAFWNAIFWAGGNTEVPTWPDLDDPFLDHLKGPWGPIPPVPFTDSFTR
jgi:hypothetical protein